MTRTDYLAELEKELRQLPKKDFQEAMDYFTEYFDEAGPENEADLMAELGTPQEAAADIITNVLEKQGEPTTLLKRPRSTKEIVIWVLLILMASPILFLIAFAILAVALALLAAIIGLLGFIIGIIIALACFLATGYFFAAIAIIIGFVTLGESLTLFTSYWSAMTMGFGGFFAAIGVGVLIFLLTLYLTKLYGRGLVAFEKWLSSSLRNLWSKRKWRKSHEN